MLQDSSKIVISKISKIINVSRENAVKAVDSQRVLMYWEIGKVLYDYTKLEIQKEEMDLIAEKIKKAYGSGFSVRLLQISQQFYKEYSDANALRSQINWMQYKILIRINDKDKREFYEHEIINCNWTGREFERQVNSQLYERLLLSNNKETVLKIAKNEVKYTDINQIIKDPMVLEFLGLEKKSEYYEKDLEKQIINNIEKFLLELGKGFTFVARQKRIQLDDDEFFVDLVFFNRLLKCHVIVELKTRKLKHSDIGQLQMYVNYYDRIEKLDEENKTIGILLCTSKNEKLVKFTLPEDNDSIYTSQYQLVLPKESDLIKQINKINDSGDDYE